MTGGRLLRSDLAANFLITGFGENSPGDQLPRVAVGTFGDNHSRIVLGYSRQFPQLTFTGRVQIERVMLIAIPTFLYALRGGLGVRGDRLGYFAQLLAGF